MTAPMRKTEPVATHVWRCERCDTDVPGPENPGYTPHCPACGDRLVTRPLEVT